MPVIRPRSISAIIAVVTLAGCNARSETPRADSGTARADAVDDTTHIDRVVNGLRPPVEIEGNQRLAGPWPSG